MKTLLLSLALLGALAAPAPAAEPPRFVALSLDDLGWKRLDSYGADNPWDGVPRELQQFGGVSFFLSAKVQFHGTGDARDNRFYPTHLKGLAVDQRAARLHVLHGCNMGESQGRPVAAIRLNYVGGQSHTLLINYGVHSRDWWKHKDEKDSSLSDTNSVVVWTGVSADAEKIGATHRLFKTSFDLPPSEQPVATIDVFSLFARSAFVLLGLTVETPGTEAPATTVAPSADLAQFRDELLMEVSGPGGLPINGASVKGLTLADGRSRQSAPLGRMDDSRKDVGLVTVDFPADTRTLRLSVKAGTYGPKAVELKAGPDGRMPRQASVKLPVGQPVRGVVQTPDGKPLAKAKVRIYERAPASPGSADIELAEVTTDAQGRWKSQLPLEAAGKPSFNVSHADYSFRRFPLSEKASDEGVTRGELLSGTAVFRMAPRIKITGVVRGPDGKPVARADVRMAYGTIYASGSTTAQTDAQGRFSITRSESGEVTLIVKHAAFAPFIAEMTITDQSEQVNIKLQPGQPFRGRVMEFSGPGEAASRPLVGATVSVNPPQSTQPLWTGFADAEGRFVWEQGPVGPVRVLVQQGGYVRRTFEMVASTNETEFALGKYFVAWGAVVNEATRQPVAEFTLTSGYKSSDDRVTWHSYETLAGRDGAFVYSNRTGGGLIDQTMLKLEAPGYYPQIFRAAETGWRSNYLQLRTGADARGVVRLPNGRPAAGAQIAVIGEAHLTLVGDRFINYGAARGPSLIVTGDASGRFTMPLRLSQRLVAVHESGYGETTFSNLAAQGEIVLEPWGRIEGVVKLGSQPVADASVRLSESRYLDELSYGTGALTKTDGEGRFRFERVPPGRRWLSRQMPIGRSSAVTAYSTPVRVEPGRSARAAIGGTGRPVIGRLAPDDPTRKIAWTNSNHSIYAVRPPSPRGRTPEERRAALEETRSYPIRFASDGTFRIDDVEEGSYRMNVYFYEERNSAGVVINGSDSGSLNYEFEVAPMPGGRSDEPLDLGSLELKTQRAVSAR